MSVSLFCRRCKVSSPVGVSSCQSCGAEFGADRVYRVRVYVDGVRKSRVVRKLKDARKIEAMFRSELELHSAGFVKPAKLALGEFFRRRLDDIGHDRTPRYVAENSVVLDDFCCFVGDLDASSVTREHVVAFLRSKGNTRSASYARSILKAAFNLGVREGWLEKSPAEGLPTVKIDKKKKYIPPKPDIEAVLFAADSEQRAYLLSIVYTLGRISEINSLKWSDVDFEADEITLWTRKKKGGGRTPRIIPMADKLRAALKGLKRAGEYVFINPRTGTRYDYRKKLMGSLCSKAGVKPFAFHALRHYGASTLAARGAPLADIQAILGHELLTTTAIYVQSLKASTRKTIDLLDED